MCKVSTTSFELKATSFFISWYIGLISYTTPRRMRPLAYLYPLGAESSPRPLVPTRPRRAHTYLNLCLWSNCPKEKKYDLSQVLPRLSCNPSTPLMLGHVEKVKKSSFWGLGFMS